ncbi:helix-turn-helix transcriptional regulator [Streptomyces sp. Vc74B-19]|uniref:helix-turn-helix domain-containing protein n=1 Tax=Streptomyces sp. Vc74B-19 TaxID=2741324 RepID=UPI001BFC9159|nr:helix-turn-helix transcriptional regulator [Streptomyces sp. Vc74B-19]MBT3164044.1 helix-turn-helix transcriptional regulator [Streptomyces sp. Vc74B-19]
MDTQTPEPPPEAALIKEALRRARLSAREAARRAGISETRWRQIANGYQDVGKGMRVPTTGPADTLARMAQVAGVTADQLRQAGRDDAADELVELESQATAQPTGFASDPQIDAIAALLATLPPEAQDEVLRRVRRDNPAAAQAAQEAHDTRDRHRRAG